MINKDFNHKYVVSEEPPLGLILPEDTLAIYDAIVAQEGTKDRTCSGGFFYGGLFTSMLKGKKPRDVDIAVQAPELVDLAEKLWKLRRTEAYSYSERNELQEAEEYLLAHMFPYSSSLSFQVDDLTEPKDHPYVGSCFQITGTYNSGTTGQAIDVLFTKDKIDPVLFFGRRPLAPITAIGYNAETGEYTHHRNFTTDAENWVFRPENPEAVKKEAVEKAEAKGMTIDIRNAKCPLSEQRRDFES